MSYETSPRKLLALTRQLLRFVLISPLRVSLYNILHVTVEALLTSFNLESCWEIRRDPSSARKSPSFHDRPDTFDSIHTKTDRKNEG